VVVVSFCYYYYYYYYFYIIKIAIVDNITNIYQTKNEKKEERKKMNINKKEIKE
jgi:hypothetical protein